MDRPRYHSAILLTREIAETVTIRWRKNRNRYAIPVAGALDLPDAELPVHPYLLGAWLGDGHSYSTQITAHGNDLEIADHIRACGYEVAVEPKDHRHPHVMTLTPSIPWPRNRCRRGHDMDALGRYPNGQCAECGRQAGMQWQHGRLRDPVLRGAVTLGQHLALGLLKSRQRPANSGEHRRTASTYRRRTCGPQSSSASRCCRG